MAARGGVWWRAVAWRRAVACGGALSLGRTLIIFEMRMGPRSLNSMPLMSEMARQPLATVFIFGQMRLAHKSARNHADSVDAGWRHSHRGWRQSHRGWRHSHRGWRQSHRGWRQSQRGWRRPQDEGTEHGESGGDRYGRYDRYGRLNIGRNCRRAAARSCGVPEELVRKHEDE